MGEKYVTTHTGVITPGTRLDIICALYATLTSHNRIYYGTNADLVLGYEFKPAFESPHAVIETCRGERIYNCASVQD